MKRHRRSLTRSRVTSHTHPRESSSSLRSRDRSTWMSCLRSRSCELPLACRNRERSSVSGPILLSTGLTMRAILRRSMTPLW